MTKSRKKDNSKTRRKISKENEEISTSKNTPEIPRRKESLIDAKKIKKHTKQNSESQKSQTKYQFLEIIGKGTFGCVFLAKRIVNSQSKFAVKRILLDPNYHNREIEILSQLKHKNCIRFYEVFYEESEDEQKLYANIVMEFIPQSLSAFLKRNSIENRPKMIFVKRFARQIFECLSYLHDLSICHRDIKPENILIDPKSLRLVLCDFGSAKKFNDSSPSVPYIGSRYYRAPELILGEEFYTVNIDIWSAGCVIAEIALGRPLFEGRNANDQLKKIFQITGEQKKGGKSIFKRGNINKHKGKEGTGLDDLFKNEGKDFIDFLKKLLRVDPENRMSPIQALNHPFLRDYEAKKTR